MAKSGRFVSIGARELATHTPQHPSSYSGLGGS
jgi:hypothetical protein